MTVGGTTNSTPGTRRRKISTASCARSFGTARSSRKFVSTAASVDRGARGVAIDQAHRIGAMRETLLVGERIGTSAVFGCKHGALRRSRRLGWPVGFARRHTENVGHPPGASSGDCQSKSSGPLEKSRGPARPEIFPEVLWPEFRGARSDRLGVNLSLILPQSLLGAGVR